MREDWIFRRSQCVLVENFAEFCDKPWPGIPLSTDNVLIVCVVSRGWKTDPLVIGHVVNESVNAAVSRVRFAVESLIISSYVSFHYPCQR
jgi:hypothetical protein